MLEKIKKNSVPQQVFEILKNEILKGTYPIGSKLPSENELVDILGVSRPSVKQAVRQLCFLGMAETKAGDGTYVKQFSIKGYLSQVADLLFTDDEHDLIEVIEFRKRIELGAAFLAMEHGTEEDFKKLDEIVSKMQDSYLKDFEEHSRLDYQLHYQIALASHNRYYIFMFETMSDLIFKYVLQRNEHIFHNPSDNTFGRDIHIDIVNAIENKDAATCQAIYDRKFSLSKQVDYN